MAENCVESPKWASSLTVAQRKDDRASVISSPARKRSGQLNNDDLLDVQSEEMDGDSSDTFNPQKLEPMSKLGNRSKISGKKSSKSRKKKSKRDDSKSK